MSLLGRVIVGVYVLWALFYLYWRLGTLNPEAALFSRLIYGVEWFSFLTTLLHLFMVWKLTIRDSRAAPPGLSVDIFIPTYNESTEIVRRTLIAAKHVDYPHKVWLLDDGNRPSMAALAAELGVSYLARENNLHAKAGNLNNALQYSKAQFIAIFDADHAPKRNFLDETLGHFAESDVAFVQTPQDFFNLDSFQHRKSNHRTAVWTEQSLFFRVIQRGKDHWNAAFFCGSCAIIRRSALDHIGGFATTSITEDLETSVMLHKAGFRSVYLPQALAFGIAPASANAYLRQRVRWGQGAMQVIRKEWFFLRGRLSLAQRLNYMSSTITYFDGWAKGIFYLTPAWVLLSGNMPLITNTREFLPLFLPYLLLSYLVQEEAGRGYGRSLLVEQYNMARFAGFIWATLGLIPRQLRFKVTPKEATSATSQEARAISPQIAIGILNLSAILIASVLWMLSSVHKLPLDGLIANMVWALVNSGMAFMVIRFTLMRTRFQRGSYRFPIPLPAFVRFGGGKYLMTIDDISLSGCNLYGLFPKTLLIGDVVTGSLLLPGDKVPFTATVVRLGTATQGSTTYYKSVGLSFEWKGADAEDRLGLFLFGSDLQWKLHTLSERVPTPLEVTTRVLGRIRKIENPDMARWSAAIVRSHGSGYGLLSVRHNGSPQRHLATYRKLDQSRLVTVREFTHGGIHSVSLNALQLIAQLSTPTGVVYLYVGEARLQHTLRQAAMLPAPPPSQRPAHEWISAVFS